MKPDNGTKDRPQRAGTGGSRTVKANGPLVEALRKAKGWTREEFEWQSHLAVERAAQNNNEDGRFRRRYEEKKRRKRQAGIGTTTLTNVENGRSVYVFTLKIVAETLGVPVKSLIVDESLPGTGSMPDDGVTETGASVEELVRTLKSGGRPMTATELAKILRVLLDQVS